MKLSTRSRYGLRMVLDMAEHFSEKPVRTREIAARQNISVKYLEQILIILKKAALVTSVRGPKGGHMLTRPPEKITVGEVVSALEGKMCLSECVLKPEICERSENCPARGIWAKATHAMYQELNSIRLSEITGLCKNSRH